MLLVIYRKLLFVDFTVTSEQKIAYRILILNYDLKKKTINTSGKEEHVYTF